MSRNWKDLVGRTMEGKLKPDEYNSGTFTISNLGMFGVSAFVSILPPNQGAIMAVAASTPTAVLQKVSPIPNPNPNPNPNPRPSPSPYPNPNPNPNPSRPSPSSLRLSCASSNPNLNPNPNPNPSRPS